MADKETESQRDRVVREVVELMLDELDRITQSAGKY